MSSTCFTSQPKENRKNCFIHLHHLQKKGPKNFNNCSIFWPHRQIIVNSKQFQNKNMRIDKKKLTTKTLEQNKIIERRIVRTFINTLKYYRIRAKTVCVNKNITMFDTFKLSTRTHATAIRYTVFILLLPLPSDVRLCMCSFIRSVVTCASVSLFD